MPMNAPNNTRDRKILIVDDNQKVLTVTSILLETWGFSVLLAQNGLDALNLVKTDGRVCLVLLDLWMPVMDGWEFLRRKRNDPDVAGIPVIAISAVPPVSLLQG